MSDVSNFVANFRVDGHATYVAIVPDGLTTTQTFNGVDRERTLAWIDRRNGEGRNVYFTPNPPANSQLRRKPKKGDIGQLAAVWADIDPRDDQGLKLEAERERLTALAEELMALQTPPSLIIDSGNGIQPIWLAEQPVENCAEWRKSTEDLCQRIRHTARGGVAAAGGLRSPPHFAVAEIHRQHPQRRHQDSLGLLLIHRPSAPALANCPLRDAALRLVRVGGGISA